MLNNKINLIYIASTGHSGSTLLDLVLGAHPNIWTLGEFQILPWEVIKPLLSCGCRKSYNECSFWHPIIEKNLSILTKGSIHRFRQSHKGGRGEIIRFNELPYIYSGKAGNNYERERKIRVYGKENFKVLSDVLQQTKEYRENITWLVDASKDAYRLMWLSQSGYFNIRVIHLIKDPRAFVFSVTRTSKGFSKFRKIIRMTGRWIVQNHLIEKVCQNSFSSDHVLRIRYCDLAGNPEKTIQNIMNWLCLPFNPDFLYEFRGENHGVCGNEMRFEEDGIKLDERWKINLTPINHRIIWLLSFIKAKKYGFGYKSCQ